LDECKPLVRGGVCGTPAYMAPEVVRALVGRRGVGDDKGRARYVAAGDTWAAGVCLLCMLTGRAP
jgi:serine/threonine protein kinase